jgi:MauM/NapG family ferredoxin protein
VVAEGGPQYEKPIRRSKKWNRLRRTVQILVLLLFLSLLLATRRGTATFMPFDLFLRLDPLAGISAMLASRSWSLPLALGGVTLLLTLVAGRAWCGWLCPLGTLLDWTPAHHPHLNTRDIPPYWRQVKYFLLLTIVLAAMLGSLAPFILDPITLLLRSTTSVLLPAINYLLMALERGLYHFGLFQSPVAWFDTTVRGSLLGEPSFFLPNLWLALVFASVLALNAIRPRFWCRYLCPTGAFLGLISKVSILRHQVDNAKCVACQQCATICPTGAIDPEQKFTASTAECTTCLDCVQACPTGAIAFSKHLGLAPSYHYDPSRRQFLASIALATVGAALLRIVPTFQKTNATIRPPGTSEEQLLDRCLRCGECVKICPTGGLQPSLSASGWYNVWTPALVPRQGYCHYSCNSCGQICPTKAILDLPLARKRQTVIGVAAIDEKRCLPYSEGRDCAVCEEMCPVPQKAIMLEEHTVVSSSGQTTTVLRPRVVRDLCIGCGTCEYHCPLDGEAAIRVFPRT